MPIVDLQNLKRVREIKTQYGFSPKARLKLEKAIIEKLNSDAVDLKKRLCGLDMEDEFLLLILMIAEIEQVTRLEQKQLANEKKYTVPDYLLSVRVPQNPSSAQRMFVEVKKCREGEFEFCITKDVYKKLRFYSDLYTLPLYFAIRFDTPQIKQWFLISGKMVEKFGKQSTRKVNNRKQDCYILSVEEIVKKDLSCIWLNNHISVIGKGTIITKTYDSNVKNATLIDKKRGALISHKIELANKCIEMDLCDKDKLIEAATLHVIFKKLARGKEQIKKEGTKTIVTYVADQNYFIPYSQLILQIYLHIRRQFKRFSKETDDSIEFYVNNFSDFDRKLLFQVKRTYNELAKAKVLLRVKMMPSLE